MLGIRVDRFLASTAIALLLALPAAATFAAPDAASANDQASPSAQDSQADKPAQPTQSVQAPGGNAPAKADDATSPASIPAASGAPPATDNAATAAEAKPAAAAEPGAVASQPAPAKAAGEAKPGPAAEPASAASQPAPAKAAGEAKPAPATDPVAAASQPAPERTAGEAKPADNPADKPPAASATAPAAAPEAPATAAAAAPPAGPDAAISEQLRELANGKFDRVIGGKKDRGSIEAFYSGRNYAPLWITDGKVNARANAAMKYLGHVDADGLDPADYPVPNFAAASTPADLAEAEIKLTAAVVTYAHHASVGRVHWSRVSPDIEYSTPAAEPGDVLAAIAGASDVAATLDSYEPQTAGYRALKAKLADIRGGKVGKDKPPIANGAVLKIDMADERVPHVRERLGVSGGGNSYDKALAEAVKKFQQQHDLPTTGTLTAATVEALNGRQPNHVSDIILANMERWRWMPHRFPDTYVIVNLPDFTLRVMHDDKPIWTTRIVIGKPEMPTPIMTADMKYITVNPTWNVPPSIVHREYLPALAQDPTVLARMGLRVDYGPDGVHIWQPPGDKNALGRVRFNFPNKFLVYQHDTPDKYMFAYDKRAFSHGCMRVQDPVHYAEVLLSLVRPNEGYTEDRIRKMFGSGEVDIQFPNFIPVNLTYQTAFVDDAGKLETRDDVYGRDRALIAILKGSDRKIADLPVEHRIDAGHREVMAIPDESSWYGGRNMFGGGRSYYPGGGYYGGGFFSRMFGGYAPMPVHRNTNRSKKVSNSGQTVAR
jgi:murein L,D-transpeptidase YcbB/YkuD